LQLHGEHKIGAAAVVFLILHDRFELIAIVDFDFNLG
jgi:hypothetical protein